MYLNIRPFVTNGVTHDPGAEGSIPFAPFFPALPSVRLSNNPSVNGYLAFEIPNQQLEEKALL
jgi:hypothetical protein